MQKGEGERTVFSNKTGEITNVSLLDSFWKPMQIQGFPLDFLIPSSTENKSVWQDPTQAASVSPAVNSDTAATAEPFRPCALQKTNKKERPAPILLSIFNPGTATTTSYNNQPELYLKFAAEGCFWQWGGISAHFQVGFLDLKTPTA